MSNIVDIVNLPFLIILRRKDEYNVKCTFPVLIPDSSYILSKC